MAQTETVTCDAIKHQQITKPMRQNTTERVICELLSIMNPQSGLIDQGKIIVDASKANCAGENSKNLMQYIRKATSGSSNAAVMQA